MTTLVLLILNGSSSFLHTIRTTIKAWMSLNFGKIPLLTSEFIFILADKKDNYNSLDEFEFSQDPITY